MFIAFVCLGNDQVVVHYFYPLSLSLKLPLVIAFLYFFIIPYSKPTYVAPTSPRTHVLFLVFEPSPPFLYNFFFLIRFLFRLQLPHFLSFATSYSQSYTVHHLRPTASIPCSLSSSLLLLFYSHNQWICGPIPAVHKLELLIFFVLLILQHTTWIHVSYLFWSYAILSRT